MENTPATTHIPNVDVDCVSPETMETIRKTISSFPKEDGWQIFPLYQHQGFWFLPKYLESAILADEIFKAEPTDILVCSFPKSGTTWLKALTFAIVTRTRYDHSTSPLLTKLSHDCVPFLGDFADKPDIRKPGHPLIATHNPYNSLPKSALNSDCKVVYICREPKDLFVSMYHFLDRQNPKKISLEKAFDLFSEGKSHCGPYWDHVLGFWKASQENPEKVMFMKYEDMMENTASYVKRLAEFMGYPFSSQEEEQGVVQKIVELCSFEHMSNLEVSKVGLWQKNGVGGENKIFFRKGMVGDWKNWLTPEMARRLDKKMEQMLIGSGLTFHVPSM
ncbi:hypothetical protein PTKIN_Ptkin12aG0030100 [Pterospermum kingtungense]